MSPLLFNLVLSFLSLVFSSVVLPSAKRLFYATAACFSSLFFVWKHAYIVKFYLKARKKRGEGGLYNTHRHYLSLFFFPAFEI
jgi:hypothetical protein